MNQIKIKIAKINGSISQTIKELAQSGDNSYLAKVEFDEVSRFAINVEQVVLSAMKRNLRELESLTNGLDTNRGLSIRYGENVLLISQVRVE